jgi:hypothetical protein
MESNIRFRALHDDEFDETFAGVPLNHSLNSGVTCQADSRSN